MAAHSCRGEGFGAQAWEPGSGVSLQARLAQALHRMGDRYGVTSIVTKPGTTVNMHQACQRRCTDALCCRQTLFVASSFGRGVRCLRAPSTSPFEETAEPTHARTWMWRVLPDACMGWHDMAVRPTVLRMLAATQRACWWRH